MRLRIPAALAVACATHVASANAQTLLTSNTITGTTINFSSLAADAFLPAAVLPGGVTLTPVDDVEFYAIGDYGLGDNGDWDSQGSASAIGVGTAFGFASFLRFTFSSPVSAVGGFMNYCVPLDDSCNGTTATIRAFDAGNNLLGSFNLATDAPISTPSGLNDGAFRGIDVGANQIAYFEYGGSFVVQGDLTFGSAAPTAVIPEPSTVALLATGLVLVALTASLGKRRV